MPSLKALGEFKSSFFELGDEYQTLRELDLPPDDLPLPDNEPEADPELAAETDFEETDAPVEIDEPAPFEDILDAPPSNGGFLDDLGDFLGNMDTFQESDDFQENDFSDFDFPETQETAPETGEENTTDDFSLPLDLLDGFADEIETGREAEEQTSFGEDDFGDLGLSDTEFSDSGLSDQDFSDQEISDQDLSDESAFDQSTFDQGAFDLGDIPDFDSFDSSENNESLELGKEAATIPTEGFDLDETAGTMDETGEDSLGDLGFSDEDFSDQSTEESWESSPVEFPDFDAGESLDFPDFEDTEDAAATEPPFDENSFDMGGESIDLEAETAQGEMSADSLDNINDNSNDNLKTDSAVLAEGSRQEQEDPFGDAFGAMDDFTIPGIDDVSGSAADEVKELNLSNEELEIFLETLASYPLNLRIACEEIIAEQVISPEKMSNLVNLLINEAPAKDTAALAGKILKRTIHVPKGYEKKTGEELETEQASFAYIFVHNFLPVLRLFAMISMVLFSVAYLSWKFIYTPVRAERIYKLGIERIEDGEYARANERFIEAFRIHEKKSWFYTYARAFREARQYTLAEEKYLELLYYTASKNKQNIPEKAAALEYADMETNSIGDYQTADQILRRNILDYHPMDRDALLALGDNSLAWGEYEPERLEDAREAYAMLMERYGRTDPLLERMLRYFIYTDNLEQVLQLQSYFMGPKNRTISASSLAEMGGYLLDKRLEKVRGVPNMYLDFIGGVREILLRAVRQDSMLPESYYHLARYYNSFENFNDERLTLDLAVRVFEAAKEESPKRIKYHIYTLSRYGEVLINNNEFFPAEENFIKGINIYQDGLDRRLLTRSAEFGKLYTNLGDLEYFVKGGDMQAALEYYRLGEENGWAPPEIQYRMGAAHYQLRDWGPALERLFASFREMPPNRRVLYALGNVSYMRGNYFAAQGYYDRLLEILEDDRSRLPPIMATDDETQLDLAERLMVVQNNLGVTLEALSERTGNYRYRARAQGLYSDSERAWDILTRNPTTVIRMRPSPDITAPGINPAYLNVQNNLHPVPGYESQFFLRIDKDALEPSAWENIAPPGYRLSEGIHMGR